MTKGNTCEGLQTKEGLQTQAGWVADVLVQEGKIVAVGQDLELPQGATVVDASDKFVMPGGIASSPHLYRGEDGQKLDLADDWASGSKAAVAGGTTTLVDLVMPER